ncbi:hypothetical protein BC830DRAFT_1140104 [Chytriomyces sp. MP71]|nr:hypothetical protein BC830DRAFT_1140104 [Chytriomyces sp. MP71]
MQALRWTLVQWLSALLATVAMAQNTGNSGSGTGNVKVNNVSQPCIPNNNNQQGSIFILTPSANSLQNSAAVVGGKLNITWLYGDNTVRPAILAIYYANIPINNGLTITKAPTPADYYPNPVVTNLPGTSTSYLWLVKDLQPGNYVLRIVGDGIDPQYYAAANPGKVQCWKQGQPFPGTSLQAFAVSGNSQLIGYPDSFGPSSGVGRMSAGVALAVWVALWML